MMRFKSARQCQRFVSTHGQVANLFLLHRKYLSAADHRQLRAHPVSTWREIALSIDAGKAYSAILQILSSIKATPPSTRLGHGKIAKGKLKTLPAW